MSESTTKFLSAKDFARRVDLHRETVYELLKDGKVPGARKIGGAWRIPEWALGEVGTPAHLATA
jgi:excisionase family DNA binding protein